MAAPFLGRYFVRTCAPRPLSFGCKRSQASHRYNRRGGKPGHGRGRCGRDAKRGANPVRPIHGDRMRRDLRSRVWRDGRSTQRRQIHFDRKTVIRVRWIAQTDVAQLTGKTLPRQELCEVRRVREEPHRLVAFRTVHRRVVVLAKHCRASYFRVRRANAPRTTCLRK
jgi:hypothetical protein